MGGQPAPLVNILPAEEQEVFLQDRLDLVFTKTFADGAAMLVVDDAARLVEHFPAPLPRQISEVGVLQIEGPQQRVEAAQFEEFPAVEGARAAAATEARKATIDGRIDAVSHAE